MGSNPRVLEQKSAVCAPVALAMAQGALQRTPLANLAIAITGVTGPKPDEDGNPVSRAFIAIANRSGTILDKKLELGPRRQLPATWRAL